MSRKKDDKRVLIPRGKRQSGSMRKRRNDYNSMEVMVGISLKGKLMVF